MVLFLPSIPLERIIQVSIAKRHATHNRPGDATPELGETDDDEALGRVQRPTGGARIVVGCANAAHDSGA